MPADSMPRDADINVALYKPARQSSYSQWSAVNDPQGGVDGIKDGNFGFCTKLEENPWWMVDLQGVYSIERIVLYNCLPQAKRADTLQIHVSEDEQSWRRVPEWDGGRFGGVDGKPAVIRPRLTQARFVRVSLQTYNHLHLDEIEVYGVLVREVEIEPALPDQFYF